MSPEDKILRKLNTPAKIQTFLNSLPFNFEKRGETYMSVRRTLATGRAHCLEGALVAAYALKLQGRKPLLMDIQTTDDDDDHVVTLFQEGKHWGAISKTNHAVLRYRDPVYVSIRELAMSYFNEYFLMNGVKTMRAYSLPFDLNKTRHDWIHSEENLFDLARDLDRSPHKKLLTPGQAKKLRKTDPIERKSSSIVEYKG